MVLYKVSACRDRTWDLTVYSKHFVTSQKCPYHVTFDLDLDLIAHPGCRPVWDHRVQVWWRSIHFCGGRSDLRKMFTDGQTDRRTDDGRRTIAL